MGARCACTLISKPFIHRHAACNFLRFAVVQASLHAGWPGPCCGSHLMCCLHHLHAQGLGCGQNDPGVYAGSDDIVDYAEDKIPEPHLGKHDAPPHVYASLP